MFYRTAGQFKTRYEDDQALFPVRQDAILLSVILAFAWVIFPLSASEFAFQTLLIPVLIYALAALGLNILTGYAGQLSLGTAAFMGVGAYACYKLVTLCPWMNPILAILLSGVFSAGVGVVFGIPSLRIKGFYLAIATLAAQFFLVWLFEKWAWLYNDNASGAIQVLGGAGYTSEWPVEQALRDTRVLAIYEGTSGIQAIDFLMRRLWREKGRGLTVFLARAITEIEACRAIDVDAAAAAETIVSRFERLSSDLLALEDDPRQGEAGALGYLNTGWCAVSAWMVARLIVAGTADPALSMLPAVARFRLHTLAGEFDRAENEARLPLSLLDEA